MWFYFWFNFLIFLLLSMRFLCYLMFPKGFLLRYMVKKKINVWKKERKSHKRKEERQKEMQEEKEKIYDQKR